MFVRIENRVKTNPSEMMLRTLGASSARGLAEKIGQFGSGFLYALALFARYGLLLTLKVCLGKDVYTFFTKETTVKTSNGDDFVISEIWMKKQNGGVTNLNISTEFGVVDWKCVTMAMREMISNAIDGTVEYGLKPSDTVIELVEDNQCRSKDGTVRIYVQVNPDISEYLTDLHKNFLCLSPFYDPDRQVLPNKSGPTKVYRRGVIVGEFGENSLFNYNFQDLPLRESRTLDSYAARESAAYAIRDADLPTIKRFLESFQEGKGYWEHGMSYCDFDPYYGSNRDSTMDRWRSAYRSVFGNAILCENETTATMVRGKGFQTLVPNETLRLILKNFADGETIRKSSDVLNQDERDGKEIHPATNDVYKSLDKIWGLIEKHGLANGKSKPKVHCYSEITKSEGNTLGYYRNGEVFILSDIANECFMLTQTMLEEVSHHVTGARDCTREFQDFAFRVATLMIH